MFLWTGYPSTIQTDKTWKGNAITNHSYKKITFLKSKMLTSLSWTIKSTIFGSMGRCSGLRNSWKCHSINRRCLKQICNRMWGYDLLCVRNSFRHHTEIAHPIFGICLIFISTTFFMKRPSTSIAILIASVFQATPTEFIMVDCLERWNRTEQNTIRTK